MLSKVPVYSGVLQTLFERKRTDSQYSNLVGTAGSTFRWRLGRMTSSTVTHIRQDPNNVGQTITATRGFSFSYDTGAITATNQANTGYLKSERSQQSALDATGRRAHAAFSRCLRQRHDQDELQP
ncbi:hypothetical protein HC761_00010 [bacterium]|nr:hypothetical protein [bacterium]